MPRLQPAQRAAWQARLGLQAEFGVCMWVSANAVSYFYMKNMGLSHISIAQEATESVATLAPPSMAQSGYVRHWATGPGTVAALLQHGVPEA